MNINVISQRSHWSTHICAVRQRTSICRSNRTIIQHQQQWRWVNVLCHAVCEQRRLKARSDTAPSQIQYGDGLSGLKREMNASGLVWILSGLNHLWKNAIAVKILDFLSRLFASRLVIQSPDVLYMTRVCARTTSKRNWTFYTSHGLCVGLCSLSVIQGL